MEWEKVPGVVGRVSPVLTEKQAARYLTMPKFRSYEGPPSKAAAPSIPPPAPPPPEPKPSSADADIDSWEDALPYTPEPPEPPKPAPPAQAPKTRTKTTTKKKKKSTKKPR
jgi:hypothetical protein